MRVGRQREAVIRTRRTVRIEAEILRPAQRRLRHVADRLPGIDALDIGDLVGARLDRIGDSVQHLAPMIAGCPAPAGAKRPGGGFRRAIDLGGTAARDRRDHAVVDRRLRLEGLTTARIGLAVDQMRDRLVAEALQEPVRLGDRLVERVAHAALALRSRMPLRSRRVSESIS
jgi:hypothetical protein